MPVAAACSRSHSDVADGCGRQQSAAASTWVTGHNLTDGAQLESVSTPLKTTKTIERTDTRVDESTRDDTPKFFHYVKKDQIVNSAVNGSYVVALCGETFPVKKSAKPGSPVCPDCERIYKSLRRK